MPNEPAPSRKCPLCGTAAAAAAKRCVVCAAALPPEPRLTVKRSGDPTGGFGLARGALGSDPALPIPLIVGALLLLITIGLLLILFAQGINPFVEPTPTVTSTPTLQPTFTAQPTRTPTSTPTSTPLPPLVHKVQEADSCIRLAAIYNVAVQSILQLNSFAQACPLYVGQEVLVPQPTLTPVPTGTSTLPAPQLTQESRPTHAVLAGESLSSIAALYAINFNVLAEVNGKLPPDYAISIGEVLRIPLDAPAPTAGPTPTATALPPYNAPRLLVPADGAAVSQIDQTVALQWASVGLLRANEVYLITVEDVTANSAKRLEATTLTTRYIVTVEMKPFEAVPHVFKWKVVTARQTGVAGDGRTLYEPAGATSAERTFTWTGIGIVPTLTPAP